MDNACMYGKKKLNESLRKGPDLEKYLEGRKRRYTTYAAGARKRLVLALKKILCYIIHG